MRKWDIFYYNVSHTEGHTWPLYMWSLGGGWKVKTGTTRGCGASAATGSLMLAAPTQQSGVWHCQAGESWWLLLVTANSKTVTCWNSENGICASCAVAPEVWTSKACKGFAERWTRTERPKAGASQVRNASCFWSWEKWDWRLSSRGPWHPAGEVRWGCLDSNRRGRG